MFHVEHTPQGASRGGRQTLQAAATPESPAVRACTLCRAVLRGRRDSGGRAIRGGSEGLQGRPAAPAGRCLQGRPAAPACWYLFADINRLIRYIMNDWCRLLSVLYDICIKPFLL